MRTLNKYIKYTFGEQVTHQTFTKENQTSNRKVDNYLIK